MKGRVILGASLALALLGGGLLWAANSGGDGDAGRGSTTEPYEGGADLPGMPPGDLEALAAVYDPILEPVGLRLTRAGLTDGPGAAADPSLRGRHLALYVEPLDSSHTPEQYVDSLLSSTRVFLPDVFERWPALASMDVCQEPPPGVDDRPVPPQVTVLELTAAQAAKVSWAGMDLVALMTAAETQGFALFANAEVEATAAWATARAEAEGRAPAASGTGAAGG